MGLPYLGRVDLPLPTAMERRLHIGGTTADPAWELFNILPGPGVNHVGNANDLSRFADDTFGEIYASHVLEHLDYIDELILTLVEWRRVLVPGGTLHLSVPDLEILARLFLDRSNLDIDERFQVMRMIFGGHVDAHDYHLVGLDFDFLEAYLANAGYDFIERVASHGLFQDTSTIHFKGFPISLNVVAHKPSP